MNKMDLPEIRLKLFNTETLEKEEISPSDYKTIRMYTCGPTVYNFPHIGNFRTYVFEDLLRRTIKFFKMPIIQVMNLTDVEDKTIKGAIEKNISLKEYTTPFIDAFFEDLKTLNIEPVEYYPKATDYIDEMIQMVQTLLDKKIAYIGKDSSVYFSINRFPSYGRLSHLKLQELEEGASQRIEDEYDKENASDFVLWKHYNPKRDGNIFWESPFGKGRPGWHIECSAMAIKLLGEGIDIHCGGVDNIFPHHENEIAQAEGCCGKPFVHHWVHAEHLLVDQKKMSKSLGNFYTLRDLLQKGYTGREIRYLLLQTHYKTQLNFTFQALDASRHSLQRISSFTDRIKLIDDPKEYGNVDSLLQEAYTQFAVALADDINISIALSSVFDLIRKVNTLCDDQTVGSKEAEAILNFFKKIDQVLGVVFQEDIEIEKQVLEALEQREKARRERNFSLADQFRNFIVLKGYEIEDTPKGPRLKRRIDGSK